MSESRFSSLRDPSRQESRQPGPAPADERGSYAAYAGGAGGAGGQAPPQFTMSPLAAAAHAPQQPQAYGYQNPYVASPGLDNSPIRNPASTINNDRDPFPAELVPPNQRSVPETSFFIPRKPVNKPPARAGKRILIAMFGMTGTGKTSFITTLAGEAAHADRLRIGDGLESYMYFDLLSLRPS